MGLLQLLPKSKLGLQGKKGPEFENVSQQGTSNIQALVKGQNLVSSQDMKSGRIYGNGKYVGVALPSQLDLDGKTPTQYLDNLPG